MLTKPSSGLVTRERRRKSAPSSCPNEAPDQGRSEVESGVELMSSRKYSTIIIIMPWEAGPGIILEEKKRKPLLCFEGEGAARQRKRRAAERWGRSIQTGNSSRKSWPAS